MFSPPVHSSTEKVRLAVVTPDHGSVDLLNVVGQPQVRDVSRVSRFFGVVLEHPVLASWFPKITNQLIKNGSLHSHQSGS
jgi:hypothetical protein